MTGFHGLIFIGADSQPRRFPLSWKLLRWEMKVTWHQKDNIICRKQRWNRETTKLDQIGLGPRNCVRKIYEQNWWQRGPADEVQVTSGKNQTYSQQCRPNYCSVCTGMEWLCSNIPIAQYSRSNPTEYPRGQWSNAFPKSIKYMWTGWTHSSTPFRTWVTLKSWFKAPQPGQNPQRSSWIRGSNSNWTPFTSTSHRRYQVRSVVCL